ncbi:type IV pilus biogenesis/stability protein PilW [Ramlibacter sp.]|uniref:type IV pilus biogenesis/stability protein PilW n=1 Tax=Ramlibacter sp. TaxID=1917967 RepID=UPI0017DC67BB|nr:type IV pilus biogenesis/stability protein PilW [Ramlibacter sp.]MBA2674300.1 type IV pilus biogenesis/stability protein PilW [Ramlibacter sp.]
MRLGALWAWGTIAAIAWLGLAGCASQQATLEADTSSAGLITPSDESESRRRARIRLELAVGYFEQGKVDVALDELKQVIAIDPTFGDAFNLRGLIFMRLNDTRQAEDSFRRALSINPRDSNTLHNYGWMQCQAGRYDEASKLFDRAVANPLYADRAKTLMAMGVCLARAGRIEEAERSLARSYELDAANPVTGYNLANLLFRRGDFQRAQFYIRRLNNSELANAESLWLGIKVERRMNDADGTRQLGEQLRKRFPQSKERIAFDRGAFDE